jgi:hypothetical protein
MNPKWPCLLSLCQLPGNCALSRAVRTLLELDPCSPQLALHVQMHELCVCPMLVLTAHLHPQGPVFDLMCAHCHACKESAKQVEWLVQAYCNSGLLRATRHHNSMWPECNWTSAILSITSCSSRTCNNMTLHGKQTCITGVAKCHGLGPAGLTLQSHFHWSSSYKELDEKFHLSSQVTARLSTSTILLDMRFSLDLATKGFGERSRYLSEGSQYFQQCKGIGHELP